MTAAGGVEAEVPPRVDVNVGDAGSLEYFEERPVEDLGQGVRGIHAVALLRLLGVGSTP